MSVTNSTTYIGSVCIPNRVALAPMAGICDKTYRRLAKEQGVGLVCTEMVSAKGLLYENEKTARMIQVLPEEHPVSVQLFGREPEVLAAAAERVAAAGADIVDLNMGCPVAKVVRNGEGSALMKDPVLAARIVRAMVQAVAIPVTVKLRLGWDAASRNAAEVAARLEDAGAAALVVHGRTREQLYTGRADWEAVGAVVRAVSIPVWGNGDVTDGPSARRLLEQTGCAGVAVGRAALGYPFVFREILHYLETGEELPPPSREERAAMMLRHLRDLAEEKGEAVAVREMRTHAVGYLRGLRGAAAIRRELMRADSIARWTELIAQIAAPD